MAKKPGLTGPDLGWPLVLGGIMFAGLALWALTLKPAPLPEEPETPPPPPPKT